MTTKKRGFTLVELLVVIAIIGILVALLLPAVQAAREAARRSQCNNNLKQISLGVHNYVDTYKQFPTGAFACCWGTWMMGIFPYIEHNNLYEQYQFLGSIGNASNTRYGGALNLPVTTKQIETYTCPSDGIAKSGLWSGITFHNYVGNYGNTTLARTTPFGTMLDGTTPNRYGGAPFVIVSGPASRPQKVGLQEMYDGTSNTLLFSETVQGRDGDLRGFGWWNGGSHFETYLPPNASQPDVLENIAYCKPANPLNPPCVGQTPPSNPTHIAARSRHPGGVQASLCDGSVRFISNNINLDVWRAVGTAYGKEPAQLPQ